MSVEATGAVASIHAAATAGQAAVQATPGAPAGFDSVPAQSKAPAVKAAPEMYEVQVDGKPVKMSLEEMKRHAGLGKKSYANLEEAAKMRKETEAKLDRIKTPKAAIKFLSDPANGFKPEEVRAEFEAWYAENFIDPETMTPEQKRIAELERKNKDYEESEKERQAKAEAEENDRLDKVSGELLQRELTQMLEESGMPKTKFTASRLAYWIRVNEAKGINAPKEMIIEQVKTERNNIVKSMAEAYDGEQLVQHLGEDIVKKIRQYDLGRIRAARGVKAPEGQTFKSLGEDAPAEKISVSEVKRRSREFK